MYKRQQLKGLKAVLSVTYGVIVLHELEDGGRTGFNVHRTDRCVDHLGVIVHDQVLSHLQRTQNSLLSPTHPLALQGGRNLSERRTLILRGQIFVQKKKERERERKLAHRPQSDSKETFLEKPKDLPVLRELYLLRLYTSGFSLFLLLLFFLKVQ